MLDPKKAKLCECGCGNPTRMARMTKRSKGHIKGQPLRFINGHNRKGAGHVALSYNRHINRWVINCRDGSRILYYRAVMENKIGRALLPEEVVHHKDEDPTNDDPDNLILFPNQVAHMKAEHIDREAMAARGKLGAEKRWAA